MITSGSAGSNNSNSSISRVRTLVRSSSDVLRTKAISRSKAGDHVLVEDLHIGGSEGGLDVVGGGIGRGHRVGTVRGGALEKRHLPQRAFGLGMRGIDVEDGLIRRRRGREITGLQMLARLCQGGIDGRLVLGIG